MTDFTHRAWDGSASRWSSAAAFAEACRINLNTGDKAGWTKDNCKLPYREPDGAVNVNGIHAAAAALAGGRGGVQANPAAKRTAARKLVALYRELKETVPDAIRRMAL